MLLGGWELFTGSVKERILGLGFAVGGAGVFVWLVGRGGFVPPSLAITHAGLTGLRPAPSLPPTVGALIAGIVGAFGTLVGMGYRPSGEPMGRRSESQSRPVIG